MPDRDQRLRPQVLHRRRREPMVIHLDEARPISEPPHARKHAKTFVLALVAIILTGALLLATPLATEDGSRTPFVDALFTAVSASAVTGLVSVETQDHWNFFGELTILILIQTGGLGFMVGAGVLLQMIRRGQSRLSDVMLMHDGAPTLSIREAIDLSGRIMRFTFITEGIGALLLTLAFWRDRPFSEALWHGIFHSVSAFCNAGFDLQGDFASLIPYRSSVWVSLTIVALIQAGALSFVVLSDVNAKRSWKTLAFDTKLVLIVNALVLMGAMLSFMISEWNYSMKGHSIDGKLLESFFQSVAARTAGFTTVNWADAHAGTLFIWVIVMGVGGAAGSTAGGIKLSTIGVLFLAVVSTLRGDEQPRAFGRTIPMTVIMRAVAVIFVFITVHFLATLGLIAAEYWLGSGSPTLAVMMFEAMSAAATVGLSTGITPQLTEVSKLILTATMFFGRLGPLTVAYSLQQRQKPARYRFPTAQVRIG